MGLPQVELTADPGAHEKVWVPVVDEVDVSIGEPGVKSSRRSSAWVTDEGIQ